MLSARYTIIDSDGDISFAISAIESAVDQQAKFFLSSSESQRVIFSLWTGGLVQHQDQEDRSIMYKPYKLDKYRGGDGESGVVAHFDTSRLSVPRYQFVFRITLWVLFIGAYTWATQSPDRSFGVEDWILYGESLMN